MPRNIAYLRVSTADLDLEKSKAEILNLANDKNLGKVEFVQEKISGKKSWRLRKVAGILDELAEGDTILLNEFSRLGRSVLEIMEIICVATQKGIRIYTVKGNWQLDDSIQSKVMAMVFAMAAEIERDLISKRTVESIASIRAEGKSWGRPKGPGRSKLDPHRPEIVSLLRTGSSQKYLAGRYQVTEATLSNWIKKNDARNISIT